MSNVIKIVHVTESYGGGVTSAINTYVKNSSKYQHILFACLREQDVTGEENSGLFSDVIFFKRKINSIYKVFFEIRKIKPDVIHIHSTYAGFFIRILPFSKEKIVYTPHGFAFLRDSSIWVKKIIYWVEKILTYRTRIIAGCGLDEVNIAKQLNSKVSTIALVNICEQTELKKMSLSSYEQKSPLIIGMVGRVCAQKGFSYFGDVAKKFKNSNLVKFVWIGGGPKDACDYLEQSGVTVSGWLKREEVVKRLYELDVYFHTAAWDGFPISVLEAAELNLPLMLRDIGPFSAEGLSTLDSAEECQLYINNLINENNDKWNEIYDNSKRVREYHTTENLSMALDRLYGAFK